MRVTRGTVRLPSTFPTQQASTAVEYGPVSVGGSSYLLPIRSTTETDNPLGCDPIRQTLRVHFLNETRFSSYRLFHAESKLVAEGGFAKAGPAPAAHSFASVPAAENAEPIMPELPPAPALPEFHETTKQPVFYLPQPPPFEVEKAETKNIDPFATHATFRERLSVVTVPVVVRDHEGHAVVGLTKDDFELFDNGKRQSITNFAEQRAPGGELVAGSSPPNGDKTGPDRYLAYAFDDLHLTFGDLSQTRSAFERVLTELLDRGTRVAIFTTSARVSLGFTKDRSEIVAALSKLRAIPVPQADCPEVDYYTADRIVNQNDSEALRQEARMAIEKCVVNPQFPELAIQMALKAARRSLEVHNAQARVTLDALRGITLAMSVLPGERSMVFVSPGFSISVGRPGVQEVIDRAARSG